MTPSRWMSLKFREQKKALAEAVSCEDEWEWADDSFWQAFFEECEDSQIKIRRFVDIQKLRNFYGRSELDDCDEDMGMDVHEYRRFSGSLFGNLSRTLIESDESFELTLLDAVGATFVTVHSFFIRTCDSEGDGLLLRLTVKNFTDGRAREVVGPFESDEAHGSFDDWGEWMEVATGLGEDIDTFDTLVDYDEYDIPDLPEVDDHGTKQIARDMELRARLYCADDDEMLIPGYDEENDSPLRGLGDFLYE